MNKEEIRQVVHEYILDNSQNYAIMINGRWGVGKTYLYKKTLVDDINKIENGKNERKTNIYISLYGISNIENLSKEVLANFMVYSVGKGNKLFKKTYKKGSSILSLVAKSMSFTMGPVVADFSKSIEGIEKFVNPENMIICFDDLERCTIPINELFGFINNLVEYCNSKVIILADERNIGKIYANTNVENKYLIALSGNREIIDVRQDNNLNNNCGDKNNKDITIDELKKLNEKIFSENYLYRDIKEKVVGRTYLYSPDLIDIIKDFIGRNNSNINKEYKDFLIENINEIVSCFNEVDTSNVRIIIRWIYDFKSLYICTNKYYANDKYYMDIINDFMRYSIWVESSIGMNSFLYNSKCR